MSDIPISRPRPPSTPRAATEEPPLARIILILIAVGGLGLLVAAPLIAVFAEALADGAMAAVVSLGNPDALSAIRLTLLVAAI